MGRDSASPLLLPGGMRVDPGVLQSPSPETQLLGGLLQAILFALNGNPQTQEPGIAQLLQGLQMQMDTIIRMEAGEVSKNEVKRRIQKADAAAEARMAQAQEAAGLADAMENDPGPPAGIPEDGITEVPTVEAEETHDVGGEG